MKRLTRVEEDIMKIIWRLERTTVSQIIAQMGGPKPPHSTISSIVRILEKKGFVDHKAYGRTYEYFAIISKKEYSKKSLRAFVHEYFEGSMDRLVSFMVKENDLDLETLNELLDKLKEEE